MMTYPLQDPPRTVAEHSPFLDYALRDPAVLDGNTRRLQAEKIWRVLLHYHQMAGPNWQPATSNCLDVGCSAGIIARVLRTHFAYVAGVDVDWYALRQGWRPDEPHPAGRPDSLAATGLALPFASSSFAVVVCNQVYQYVPDVAQLVREIHRVLKPGGCCYWSARNLWGILSRENWHPFLAALWPVSATGESHREAWRHRAGTLWPYRELRALVGRSFTVHDYTVRVLTDPRLSQLFVPGRQRALRLSSPAVRLIEPLMPTHHWVLQKA